MKTFKYLLLSSLLCWCSTIWGQATTQFFIDFGAGGGMSYSQVFCKHRSQTITHAPGVSQVIYEPDHKDCKFYQDERFDTPVAYVRKARLGVVDIDLKLGMNILWQYNTATKFGLHLGFMNVGTQFSLGVKKTPVYIFPVAVGFVAERALDRPNHFFSITPRIGFGGVADEFYGYLGYQLGADMRYRMNKLSIGVQLNTIGTHYVNDTDAQFQSWTILLTVGYNWGNGIKSKKDIGL